ncbi:MAG: GNAT family N-acetyltransferase [Acutalibacter sp.]|nr:GNAT family N-acetyltransferase [Acutalibacter sp.]
MIRFAESPEDQARLDRLCQGSALGCRLRAVAGAYGLGWGFAQFWLSDTAAYCLLDGTLSAAGLPEDPEEARAFIQMLGPGALTCSAGFCQALGWTAHSGGPVLAKDLPAAAGPGPEFVQPFPAIPHMGRLMSAAGMSLHPESFHLDLSHRLRHGAALSFGTFEGARLTGCAVVSAVAPGEAVLSALAVEEACRGQGLGSALLRRVELALPGRRLYILREAGKNRSFYARRGYKTAGRWRSLEGTVAG